MDNLNRVRKEDLYEIYKNEICPVCGYYCKGKGGWGCIDKPKLCGISDDELKQAQERKRGRKFIGIEKEPEYMKIAEARIG